MKTFTLTGELQFGLSGPQAGAVGLIIENRMVDDEVWCMTAFEGFEGFYFVPAYMAAIDE